MWQYDLSIEEINRCSDLLNSTLFSLSPALVCLVYFNISSWNDNLFYFEKTISSSDVMQIADFLLKWTSFFIEYGAAYPSCTQRKILHRLTGLNEKGLYLEEKKFTTFVINIFF